MEIYSSVLYFPSYMMNKHTVDNLLVSDKLVIAYIFIVNCQFFQITPSGFAL